MIAKNKKACISGLFFNNNKMYKNYSLLVLSLLLLTHICSGAFEGGAKKSTLSLAVYGFGNDKFDLANEYGEIGISIISGMSLVCGASFSQPDEFNYAAISLHSDKKIIGFAPGVQVGVSNLEMYDNKPKFGENSGLLMGIFLQYPINRFTVFELNHKMINDGLQFGQQTKDLTAVAVRILI